MFNCVIHTDGFAVTFFFVRAKKKNSDIPLLTLEDFTRDEIERYFVPVTVDPGRNQIFTAAVGYDSVHHQVRSCSKEERANIAGYTRRAKRQRDVNAAKNMLTIANFVWEHNGHSEIFSHHHHSENGAAGSIPTA
ncbi:hypothetical protein BDF20DRAFT_835086 [Mycotypha africana]|uniref:uncharacterized protein n=1 Tax=Mycotypha africana TaxID=64632 RepID=UPI0023013520|nr:uncharacterized protein BDF20DRAFT_835086 [Mycotypha africana]KAI8982466.1 hypothetical protein BDF20DRAFT_835086 [Mycotypha africana]